MAIKPALQIQLNFKTLLAFLFFFFLMHELHELAHMFTGRIICGSWGTRDFNVWRLCDDCIQQKPLAILATFAGPLFTFLMLWLGWYWVKYGKSAQYRSVGLVLIFGNMPFGRIYMAATGAGDEVWGLRSLLLNPQHTNFGMIRLLGLVLVSVICIPPLITAYRAIGNKKRVLVFIGLLILPLVLDTIVILILLNSLLTSGLLSQVWITGAPLLITFWFVVCALIVIVNFKWLRHFAINSHQLHTGK